MALEVQGVVKYFGGLAAVRGVSFTVEPGECVALIGPNGAGKSTTFACIAGQHALSEGSIRWRGHALDRLTPAQRLSRGIARTFQVAQIFEALTVLQNVQLALRHGTSLSAWDDLNVSAPVAALGFLQQVGLDALGERLAKSLPYGAKKRLELAIALAGLPTDPEEALLLLDEPAAGLGPAERVDLMRLVKSLAQSQAGGKGRAVLYTEHNMDAVFGVADRVLVLIDGEIAAHGRPQEVADNPLVRARYLGNTRIAVTAEGSSHA